jgi:hypothetical protein
MNTPKKTQSASDQYWSRVQAMAGPKAENLGITEGDVDRLVQEYRQEQQAKTIKKKLK